MYVHCRRRSWLRYWASVCISMQLAWQDGVHDMYGSLILKWSVVAIFMQITVNWSQGTSDICLYMIIPLRRYTVFVQFSLNLYPDSPSDNMYSNLFVLLPFTPSRGVAINVFLVLKIILLPAERKLYIVTKMLIKQKIEKHELYSIIWNSYFMFFCFVSGIQW